VRIWTRFIRLQMGPVAGSCGHDDDTSNFIKGE
jgi:hypothetical protein